MNSHSDIDSITLAVTILKSDPASRKKAVHTAATLFEEGKYDSHLINSLKKALFDTEGEVRFYAAYALTHHAIRHGDEVQITAYLKDQNSDVRTGASGALAVIASKGKTKYPSSLFDSIIASLNDIDSRVRHNVLKTLLQFVWEDYFIFPIAIITSLLQDIDDGIRENAAYILTALTLKKGSVVENFPRNMLKNNKEFLFGYLDALKHGLYSKDEDIRNRAATEWIDVVGDGIDIAPAVPGLLYSLSRSPHLNAAANALIAYSKSNKNYKALVLRAVQGEKNKNTSLQELEEKIKGTAEKR